MSEESFPSLRFGGGEFVLQQSRENLGALRERAQLKAKAARETQVENNKITRLLGSLNSKQLGILVEEHDVSILDDQNLREDIFWYICSYMNEYPEGAGNTKSWTESVLKTKEKHRKQQLAVTQFFIANRSRIIPLICGLIEERKLKGYEDIIKIARTKYNFN